MKLSLNARARVVAESYLTAVRASLPLIRLWLTRYPSSTSEVPRKARGNIYHSGSAVCLMLELPHPHPSLCKVSAVGRNTKCTSPVAGTNGRYGNDGVGIGHDDDDARNAGQTSATFWIFPTAHYTLPIDVFLLCDQSLEDDSTTAGASNCPGIMTFVTAPSDGSNETSTIQGQRRCAVRLVRIQFGGYCAMPYVASSRTRIHPRTT